MTNEAGRYWYNIAPSGAVFRHGALTTVWRRT